MTEGWFEATYGWMGSVSEKAARVPFGQPPVPNASLLFQESILKGRFAPSGRIEGFTAEIGASGSYCPQHATLPVDVTYFDISEHSAPSPFLVRAHELGSWGR